MPKFEPVTVTKDGNARTAESPAELVRYTWDGWKVEEEKAPKAAKKTENP